MQAHHDHDGPNRVPIHAEPRVDGTSVDIRARYARIARFYDLLDWPWEALYARGRRLIGAASTGLTLEVGAGTGKNFAYYRPGAHVVASDVSWPMLARARRRATPAVQGLLIADAAHLPLRAATIETVTATFVCCVQDDPLPALRELQRVLRPGGRAMFLECVLPLSGWSRRLLRLLEPLLRVLYGVHWEHDLSTTLPASGLQVLEVRHVWRPLLVTVFAAKLPSGERALGEPTL
jgi:ubiquinone/menaquinone biosynthesis C-methylase UbiE